MTYNPTHQKLIQLIRDNPKTQDPSYNEFMSLDDETFCRFLFLNYRKTRKKERGLRLTHQGVRLFESLFQGWDIPIDEEHTFNNRWLIILDRECTLPYYLKMDERKITVFEKELGVLLKLAGGNVEMLENAWTDT